MLFGETRSPVVQTISSFGEVCVLSTVDPPSPNYFIVSGYGGQAARNPCHARMFLSGIYNIKVI